MMQALACILDKLPSLAFPRQAWVEIVHVNVLKNETELICSYRMRKWGIPNDRWVDQHVEITSYVKM